MADIEKQLGNEQLFLANYKRGLTDVNLEEMTEVFKKRCFDAAAFRGLTRLRGMKCRSPDRYRIVLRKGPVWVGDYAEG